MSGVVVWEGLSRIDNVTPIVVILTGLGRGSANRKTGAMVQSYILRADMPPMEAVMTRDDGAICGGCVHRKQSDGRRTCYVNVGQGPTSVWKTYARGGYLALSAEDAAPLLEGLALRLGTYGDPAAAPLELWETLTRYAGGYTGYTHQWRARKFAGLARLVSASCETAEDVDKAHAMGYRGTFRVLPLGDAVPSRALHCPASAERGHKVTCSDCLACNGTRDVVIYAHGPSRNFYTGGRRLPVL